MARAWFRPSPDRARAWRLVVVLLCAAGLFSLLVASIPPPELRSTLAGTSERLDVLPSIPDHAAIRVGKLLAESDDEATEGRCVAGLLTPAAGTRITLHREGTEPLVIRLDHARAPDSNAPVAFLDTGDGRRNVLTGGHRLRYSDQCPGNAVTRLALQGDVEFGREIRPASPTAEAGVGQLREASLTVFAHAVDEFLGFIRLPPTLYQVLAWQLPAGSRIRAETADFRRKPVWWGLVRVEKDKPGLSFHATTSAQRLVVLLPGADPRRTVVQLGSFRRLAEDPNLLITISLISFAAPLIAAPLLGWLRRLVRRLRAGDADAPPDRLRGGSLALLLLLASPAAAEPVRLRVGGDASGQGWMFTDASGICRIVTAAHVLERDGRLLLPSVTDRTGSELAVSEPLQPDRDVDVAFLIARPARPCASGGLHEATVDSRLAASPQAFLEFLGERSGGTLPLLRRARAMDEDGGRIAVFDRGSADFSIAQGMSGGMVVDRETRPLAVIIGTDPEANRARGVRVDVAAALLRGATTPRQAAALRWSVQHGRSADPQRGPDQLAEGGAGWVVVPDRGFVVVTVMPTEPLRLDGVLLRVEEDARGRIGTVQLFGSADARQPAASWPALAACAFPPGSGVLACDFAPRRVAAIRLQLRVEAPQATLGGLALLAR